MSIWVSPIPWGQGMESKGCAGRTPAGVSPSSPAMGLEGWGRPADGSPGSQHGESGPPPQHRHQLPMIHHGRGPLFISLLRILV